MSKYELLTKHISTFESNDFGEWFVDKENDGSMEHPIPIRSLLPQRTLLVTLMVTIIQSVDFT